MMRNERFGWINKLLFGLGNIVKYAKKDITEIIRCKLKSKKLKPSRNSKLSISGTDTISLNSIQEWLHTGLV